VALSPRALEYDLEALGIEFRALIDGLGVDVRLIRSRRPDRYSSDSWNTTSASRACSNISTD
jgi:hypothetical protein